MSRLTGTHLLLDVPHVETVLRYQSGERIDLDRSKYNGGDLYYGVVAARGAGEIQAFIAGAGNEPKKPPQKVRRAMIEFVKGNNYKVIPGELGELKEGDDLTISVTRSGYQYKARVKIVFEPKTSD